MLKIIGVLVLAALPLLVPGPVDATGRAVRAVNCGHAAYVAPVYAAPAYYAVPVYSVGYQPDLSALVDLAQEMKGLRQDFAIVQQQLAAAGGGPIKAFASEHPGAILMRRDCAKCHDSTVAKAKGRGVILFERGVFIDTPENVEAAVEQVDQGRMPKDKKWGGAEKYDFLAYHTLRAKDDQPKAAQAPATSTAPAVPDIDRLIIQRLDVILQQRLPAKEKMPAPPPEKKPPDTKPMPPANK